MTAGALAFMIVSWACVLGLAGWAYSRVLRGRSRDRRP
jgi:hypothetical protein